ncbi:hypothetical protein DH2020_030618 [Rehmannia glutinosa]|uniref:Reverse transcriptase zinc-binding domain-containing protein n=1 Tax=Rehmannia glutinosa TaxID=99300 RepID=A0ABR0VKF5_REHGL
MKELTLFVRRKNKARLWKRLLIASKFWWGSSEEKGRKIYWAKWEKLAEEKEKGGLGFKDIHDFNLALIAKQIWRVLTEPTLLMSKVIKGKYFPVGDFFSSQPHSYDSWMWRCWLKAKEVIRLGARLSVGGDNNFRIWNSPWLPKFPSFLPDYVHRDGNGPIWVKELLNDEGNEWNKDLVCTSFSKRDAELILSLPLSQNRGNSKLIWHHNKKGHYTVKSAYEAIRLFKQIQIGTPESSDANKGRKKMWRSTWKLNIKNKLKHFLWKCINDILPTSTHLIQRGIKMDDICCLCGCEVETPEHLFFQCSRAQDIWKMAPVKWTNHPEKKNHLKIGG